MICVCRVCFDLVSYTFNKNTSKNKKEPGENLKKPWMPTLALVVGCLYMLKLAAEKSFLGIGYNYISQQFLPSYGEWGSLHLGLFFLVLGWVLTLYQSKKSTENIKIKTKLLWGAAIFCGAAILITFSPNSGRDPCSGSASSYISDTNNFYSCSSASRYTKSSLESTVEASTPVVLFLVGVVCYFYSKKYD